MMRLVANGTCDVSFRYRMRMRQAKGTARVEMALETGLGIGLRVVNSTDFSAGFIVNASRSVA